MLTKTERHNIANAKWRAKNRSYFKQWNRNHPNYQAPSHTYTYTSWMKMLSRCYNPNCRQYRWYGAKGIQVKYKSIVELIQDIGERPKGLSIDRINNNGHYEIGNCKWSTQQEQCQNRGGLFASH